jgi:hypothetical protein
MAMSSLSGCTRIFIYYFFSNVKLFHQQRLRCRLQPRPLNNLRQRRQQPPRPFQPLQQPPQQHPQHPPIQQQQRPLQVGYNECDDFPIKLNHHRLNNNDKND